MTENKVNLTAVLQNEEKPTIRSVMREYGMPDWDTEQTYAQNTVANVPGVAPVVCVNAAGSTGNNPEADDGMYWRNWLNTHSVTNSSTAFGIPLKAGTTVLDLATGLYYRTTATRAAAHTLGDGSAETTVNTGAKNLIINGDKVIQQRGTTGGKRQVIDAENVKLGGTYTVSFTGTATVRVYDATSLGATDAATTWSELTSGASASGTTVTVTAGRHIKVEFSSTDFSFVQFEIGSVATGFEQTNYGVELAKCQRYYWKSGSSAAYGGDIDGWWGYCVAGASYALPIKFPQTMRTAPVVILIDSYASGFGAPTFDSTSVNGGMLSALASTTANSRFFRAVYSADAEHFTDTHYEDRWF